MLTQIEVTQRYSTKFQIAGRSVQQFSIYILTNRQRERFEKATHRDSKASEKGTVNEIGSTNTNKEKRKWKNRLNFACRFDTWSMRCRNAFKIVHECDSHCFIYVLYYYYYYYCCYCCCCSKVLLVPTPSEEIIIEKFGICIRRKDLSTLAGTNWVNDQVSRQFLW